MFSFSYAEIEEGPTCVHITMQKIEQPIPRSSASFSDKCPVGWLDDLQPPPCHVGLKLIENTLPMQEGDHFKFLLMLSLLLLRGESLAMS